MSSGTPLSNMERSTIAVVQMEEGKGPAALTFYPSAQILQAGSLESLWDCQGLRTTV